MQWSLLRYLVVPWLASMLGFSSVKVEARPQFATAGEVAKGSESQQVFHDFARCLYAGNPNLVFRWLLTLPGSAEEKKIVSLSLDNSSSCLVNSYHDNADTIRLTVPTYQLRLAIAEVALSRYLTSLPYNRPDTMTNRPWFSDFNLTDEYLKSTVSIQALAGLSFGHCVAYSGWAETVSFLRTRPSLASNAALSTLKPLLGSCLTAGSELVVTPSSLRSLLSEAVWHVVSRPSANKSRGAD